MLPVAKKGLRGDQPTPSPPFDYTAIDQELGWAHEAGYNSIRVFIQFLVWKQDPDGLKKRLEEFLSIADKHQVRVISFDAQDVVALKKN